MHLFYIDIMVFQEVKKRVILAAEKFVLLHKICIKDNKYGQQKIQVHLQLQYEVFRPSDFDLTLNWTYLNEKKWFGYAILISPMGINYNFCSPVQCSPGLLCA